MNKTAVIAYINTSWFIDEAWENDLPQVNKQVSDIKRLVSVLMTMEEYDKYMSLRWLDKTLYLRKLTIESIQIKK